MKKPAVKKAYDDRGVEDELLFDDEDAPPKQEPPPKKDPPPRVDTPSQTGLKAQAAEAQDSSLEKLAEEESADMGQNQSWRVAARIVRDYRPVPRIVWVIIRSVYGRIGNHKVDPMVFSDVEPLIIRAATDKTLGATIPQPAHPEHKSEHKEHKTSPGAMQKSMIITRSSMAAPKPEEAAPPPAALEVKNLDQAVSMIGADVAGSICFIHAVCRRIANSVAEKVWRPILDDALLRAHMGYLVGKNSKIFGPGRGMMAGFCGRSGLAIMIGSGSLDQAQSALSGLAAGVEMGEICTKVYGCNPLQVAAMAAVSAGFNRDIAAGLGSYTASEGGALLSGSEQDRWLAAFSIVENLRMNRRDDIDPNSWLVLAYSESQKADLIKKIQNVQRRGHGWGWLVKPQLSAESEG